MTNFSPDHVSSTAQIFTSTNPNGRAAVRTRSSVTVAGTPDAFLGQETQIMPFGAIAAISFGSLASSSEYERVKKCQISIPVLMLLDIVTLSGIGLTSVR